MKKNRRKLKLLICGLLACASVFTFSSCSLFEYFYNGALLGAVDIGREIGKGTVEAILTNDHTKEIAPSIDGAMKKVVIFIDEALYNFLSGNK